MKKKQFLSKLAAVAAFASLLSTLSLGVSAAADNPATAVLQIKQFRFLDKELDRISLNTTAKPDGIRDGHLKLLLDAGEGLEIKSITMRTADADGKDTNHGIWKTWKENAGDIGNLLAVVQDGKIINTTFERTLGTFKGIAELELYASDNNGMKPGENYYLVIETNLGTVKSDITPYADNELSYAPVIIREFSWQDLDSDKASIAELKEDGTKDGHFRLKLQFAQKTEVLAIVLRPTDDKGKDAYQGIWRTNRAGTGWLLGIMQGDTAIAAAFNKDVKTPVGAFRGNVTFDLYANNNGTIKKGQYYVIEVETRFGTVMSSPVKFGDPSSIYMNDEGFSFRTIALKLNSTKATVDDEERTLQIAPFTLDGRTMVPIRFVSEALGAEVAWDGKKRSVTIVKDDNRIELVIDQKEAVVNGRRTSMDSPAIIRNDITLVPIRFVSENLNMKVFFDNGEIVITDAKEQ